MKRSWWSGILDACFGPEDEQERSERTANDAATAAAAEMRFDHEVRGERKDGPK